MDKIIEKLMDFLRKIPEWARVVVCGLVAALISFFMFFYSSCIVDYKNTGTELHVSQCPSVSFVADDFNDELEQIYKEFDVDSLWSLRYDDMDNACIDHFGLSYSQCLDYINSFGYSYNGSKIYKVEEV